MNGIDNGAVGPAENPKMVAPIKLSDAIVDILNARIGDEYEAHYFYNAASNWCAGVGYMKAAEFFAKESIAELEHAKKIQQYIIDWNCLPTIPTVNTTWEFTNLPEAIGEGYNIELKLFNNYHKDSAQIFGIDLATFDFLQEFRMLQTESVKEFSDLLNGLQLIDINSRLDILHFEEIYMA